MTDATLTDMAPFFERYDRRQRLLFVAAISASLVLSAVNVAHGVLTTGAVLAVQWFAIMFFPLFIVGWWTFGELIALGRRKASSPDGRQPASADDARNGVRIANAGFVFNLVWTAAMLGGQAVMTFAAFGYFVGDWIPRVTTVALGAGTIYLGNVWPRMPTSRAPEQKPARQMKAHRLIGWFMVLVGLLIVLLGLFLPLLEHHRQ